jgi:glycosyltransferase involved in cell wall biosynthesis
MTKPSKRLKVLISAYACEPDVGSEPGVGWNTVRQAAQNHEVWVITRANNREAIEKAIAIARLPNVHFLYFDLPRWARFWKKGPRRVQIYYYLWQLGAYLAVRKQIRKVRFDVAHHITFVTYSYPSLLAFLPIPYVWGPVGGGESAPRTFWKSFGLRGSVFEMVRSIARKRGEWDPLVRHTARKAAVVVATTDETAARLSSLGASRIVTQTQAVLNEGDLRLLLAMPTRKAAPFRIFSVGRLLHWKGFHLGIEAFSRFLTQFPESEYWMIGDGPERRRLEQLVGHLGIAHRVTFYGNLSRPETLQKISDCDVMLFPSLHDSGGWVSVEAMAAGRPVVCLDLGGPALQVNAATGFKIPAIDPSQAIERMTGALVSLAKDPALRTGMADACRLRIKEEFNWSRLGQAFENLYQELASPEPDVASLAPAGVGQNVENQRKSGSVSLEREA